MKRVLYLLMLLVGACKPNGGNESVRDPSNVSEISVSTLAASFPANKLDELFEPVSQTELSNVVTKGESGKWKQTHFNKNTGELKITSKVASDNSVSFIAHSDNPDHAMMVVQQRNAHRTQTEIWVYDYKVDGDHPEPWHEKLLPEFKLESFFDDRIVLPRRYSNIPAKDFLNIEIKPRAISIQFDKWAFMRMLDRDSVVAEGPLDPALVKYKYLLAWDGDFREQKLIEAGYNDVLTFSSRIIEPEDGAPGIHEFDCGHGVSVKASSVLPKQGRYTFGADNVKDTLNAWTEGADGEGVGEWIEFTINTNFRVGDNWQISNGYHRTNEFWSQNNRVKKMRVFVDDQLVGSVVLANVSAYQSFNIAPSWLRQGLDFRKGTRIRFMIDEIYKGNRFNNTSIFYFVPVGNCG